MQLELYILIFHQAGRCGEDIYSIWYQTKIELKYALLIFHIHVVPMLPDPDLQPLARYEKYEKGGNTA